MGDVVYVSKSRVERRQGPLRVAHLPGESQPVIFSVPLMPGLQQTAPVCAISIHVVGVMLSILIL
jgi:hypothetical protein